MANIRKLLWDILCIYEPRRESDMLIIFMKEIIHAFEGEWKQRREEEEKRLLGKFHNIAQYREWQYW